MRARPQCRGCAVRIGQQWQERRLIVESDEDQEQQQWHGQRRAEHGCPPRTEHADSLIRWVDGGAVSKSERCGHVRPDRRQRRSRLGSGGSEVGAASGIQMRLEIALEFRLGTGRPDHDLDHFAGDQDRISRRQFISARGPDRAPWWAARARILGGCARSRAMAAVMILGSSTRTDIWSVS